MRKIDVDGIDDTMYYVTGVVYLGKETVTRPLSTALIFVTMTTRITLLSPTTFEMNDFIDGNNADEVAVDAAGNVTFDGEDASSSAANAQSAEDIKAAMLHKSMAIWAMSASERLSLCHHQLHAVPPSDVLGRVRHDEQKVRRDPYRHSQVSRKTSLNANVLITGEAHLRERQQNLQLP